MNEMLFAELQKDNCWFTFSMFEELPIVTHTQIVESDEIWKKEMHVQRHIFAMIFGSYGYNRNLSKAKAVCGLKIIQLEEREPSNKSLDNIEFTKWLNLFAQYCILYGTILAYQGDYIRSARYLMNGLRTGAISLFMPYCDFIRYILSRLELMPAELAEYKGCGFSVDNPMGGTELNAGNLMASAAEMVIPALESKNGGVILAYNGRNKYGNLKRLGSTNSNNFRNCIDIYEVLMVDNSNKLKKLRLYFNGYFTCENRNQIRLPDGFNIDFCNPTAKYYKFIQ